MFENIFSVEMLGPLAITPATVCTGSGHRMIDVGIRISHSQCYQNIHLIKIKRSRFLTLTEIKVDF